MVASKALSATCGAIKNYNIQDSLYSEEVNIFHYHMTTCYIKMKHLFFAQEHVFDKRRFHIMLEKSSDQKYRDLCFLRGFSKLFIAVEQFVAIVPKSP